MKHVSLITSFASLTDTLEIDAPLAETILGKSQGRPPVANRYLFASVTGSEEGGLYAYGGLL